MSSRKSVLVQPINVIFKFLQQGTRVQIWLYDNVDFRLEGKIIVRAVQMLRWVCFQCAQGFDEFMNVVMDEAEEVWSAKAATEKREARTAHRKPLGRLLLKGENITLLQVAPSS